MHARITRRVSSAALSVAPMLTLACASVPVTSAPIVASGPTTLLTRLGADTVSLEQYTRTPTHMEGVVIARSPFTNIQLYSVEIGANNMPTSATYAFIRGDGSLVTGQIPSIDVRYRADSITLIGHRPSGDTTRSIAARALSMPTLGNSYGLYELAIAHLRASGRDSAEFAGVPLGFGVRSTTSLPVRVFAGDSARITRSGSPLYARFDRGANLLGLDGSKTTIKVRVDRVAGTDLEAMAKSWSALEKTAGVAGAASTRDTVKATLGNAHLWVDYGRPALRGRNVWVDGVLGDSIWRTGANAATQLRTDADIRIGGALVSAGTYTLWTATTPLGHQLIINKQFGQWGTEYHPDRDLARVALTESQEGTSVERFTIAIDPRGMMSLQWGTRKLSVLVESR